MGRDERLVQKKYRILLVVRWPVGGIRTFLKYVFQLFPENEFEFALVTVNSEGVAMLKDDIGGLVSQWVLVDDDGDQFQRLLFAVTSTLKSGRFDLIHAQGFTSAAIAYLPSLVFRTPVLLTSHDVINASQFSGIVGAIKKYLLGRVLRHCRVVHSVSVDAEENLENYFPEVAGDRRAVILNGIDAFHFYSSEALDLCSEYGIAYEKKIIGFFGRFMSQKGFRYLIDAVEDLSREENGPDFHVICFGAGAYIREEKALIESRGLSGMFTFAPFLADVSRAMKGCDMIVMPSLWEACPLQPMEALCSGIPFVGTDCIGLREVIEGTPAIMVKAGNRHSLAWGIKHCLKIGRKPFQEYAPEAVARFEVRDSVEAIRQMYLKVVQ